jgi:hypothetical protein
MKNRTVFIYSMLACIMLSGCEVIGDIFKAGVWVGILIVALVLVAVVFILSKVIGKK